MKVKGSLYGLFFILLGCILSNCAVRPYYKIDSPNNDGNYSGSSNDGQQIFITINEEDNEVYGIGSIGNKNVVFLETATRESIGKLVYFDGSVHPASIFFTNDGKIILNIDGQQTEMNSDKLITSNEPDHLFSGHYITNEMTSFMEALFLIQSGDIIAGSATVVGQKGLINGRVKSNDSFQCKVTMPNETEFEFDGKKEGKNKLVISGFGEPVIFERK